MSVIKADFFYFSGSVLMSLHYETTMNVFHRVLLTVAVSGINTCTSLLGNPALSSDPKQCAGRSRQLQILR